MKHKFLLLLFSLMFVVSAQERKLALNDIFTNSDFYGKSLNGVQWFDGGNKFSYFDFDTSASANSIYQHDILTGEEKLLVSAKDLINPADQEQLEIKNYKWSAKENYILFTETIHARSVKTGGAFHLYDVQGKKIILSVSRGSQVNIKHSPDEKKIGFVRDNNLFVIDIETKKETQLTFDGSDVILNGVFDWAYEEEFSIIEGWEWSPDSRKIAFWRLDQSNVPIFSIIRYDSLYNRVEQQRYPKVDANISEVKIGVADISSAEISWLDASSERDIYIPRMKFTNNPDVVSIQRLNRLQNKLELLFADLKTGKSKIIITEVDEHWVDVYDHFTFLKNSERFIWSSERDGFLHIYLYDYNGRLIDQVTKGSYEVDKIISVDEENEIIYYTSNERSTLHTDLYSIKLDGSGKKRLTNEAGTHNINLSINNKFFIDKFSNAKIKTSISTRNIEGEIITEIYEPDMSFIEDFEFTPVEFFTFKTSDNVELDAYMIKPHNFKPEVKYPVVISNYSGPGSKGVEDKWMGINYYLSQLFAQEGFLTFVVDNRGTNGKGKEFEHIVYKNLGKWELNDISEGIRYISSLGFADTSRVAIHGASYGGYMAALALLKAPDLFKVGIAGLSITDWRFYDAIYTERFMQTPELNPKGYEESAPVNYAGNLKGKLLIIHGTADDNVHFQNSAALIDALAKNGKIFDTMIYPDKRHGGFGRQYYYLFVDYILKNL